MTEETFEEIMEEVEAIEGDKEKYPHYPPASEIEMIPKPENWLPDPNFPPDHRFYGKKRCHAWSRRQGRQCMKVAMTGNNACYVHGGASPSGIVAARYKHGRYSKYLPANLREKYEEMQNDPELLSLRNEIEMVSARIAELFETLDKYGIADKWIKDLKAAHHNFRMGVQTENQQRAGKAFDDLEELIEEGAKRKDVWSEIGALFETRKRLAIAERERIAAANAMWTAEQAMLFVSTVSGSFKDVLEKHIGDREKREDILKDLALIIRKLVNKPES
jgi:uncharacterized protein YjcR